MPDILAAGITHLDLGPDAMSLQLPQRMGNHGAITPMTCPLRLFQRTN